mgnify:CR=1 FL=1
MLAGAPGVPEFWVCCADIAYGQHIEIIEVRLARYRPGKGMNDVRVGNVFALRSHGHQQMVFHEP